MCVRRAGAFSPAAVAGDRSYDRAAIAGRIRPDEAGAAGPGRSRKELEVERKLAALARATADEEERRRAGALAVRVAWFRRRTLGVGCAHAEYAAAQTALISSMTVGAVACCYLVV